MVLAGAPLGVCVSIDSKEDKVVCFDRLLQVLILNDLTVPACTELCKSAKRLRKY